MKFDFGNPTPSKSGKFLDVDTWDALVKSGVSEKELYDDQPYGPIISSYTRKQAIDDGVLIDVTALARQVGFRLHTVMTCGVVAEVAGRMKGERMQTASLLAVLQTLHEEIRKMPAGNDRIHFDIGLCKLWALCGPGDDAEPVLTIMLEGED